MKLSPRRILSNMIDHGIPLTSHAVISLAYTGEPKHLEMYDKMMKFYRPSQCGHIERIRFLTSCFNNKFDTQKHPIELTPERIPLDGNHRFTFALRYNIKNIHCYIGRTHTSRDMSEDDLMKAYGFDRMEKLLTLAEIDRLREKA
jgi:hypothetical protein